MAQQPSPISVTRRHLKKTNNTNLEPLHKVINRREENLILPRKDQHLLGLCIPPPLNRRKCGLAPGIAFLIIEIRTRPHRQRVLVDQVLVHVRVNRGPVRAEANPRREPEHAGEVGLELDGLDFRVWVGEVQQQREGEVPACGVAADDDVGWRAVCLCEDVAEGFDGLAQLGWVRRVRGEGVCEEEDGDVVAGCVEVGDDARQEVDVGGCAGEGESAACCCQLP